MTSIPDLVPPPELLWHYTDGEGVRGIINSAGLWLTDVGFLNDSSELVFGREPFKVACDAFASTLAAADDRPGWSSAEDQSSIAQFVRKFALDMANDQEPHYPNVFSCSFCESGDLLSQWRGYGQGGGYAIGFDGAALAELTPFEIPDPRGYPPDGGGFPVKPDLVRVVYGASHAAVLMRSLVRDLFADKPLPALDAKYSDLAMGTLVHKTLAQVKDPTFSEEGEWRLVMMAPPNPVAKIPEKFRIAGSTLVPYVFQQINLSHVIREIKIGPGESARRRRQGIDRLLVHAGLKCTVKVSLSVSPFSPT